MSEALFNLYINVFSEAKTDLKSWFLRETRCWPKNSAVQPSLDNDRLRDQIEKLIWLRLGQPPPISLSVLCKRAKVCFHGCATVGDFDGAYARFTAAAMDGCVTDGIVQTVEVGWIGNEPLGLNTGPSIIYRSQNGYCVAVRHTSKTDVDSPGDVHVFADLIAQGFNRSAARRANQQTRRILRSALRTLCEGRHFENDLLVQLPKLDNKRTSRGMPVFSPTAAIKSGGQRPDQRGLMSLGMFLYLFWDQASRKGDLLRDRMRTAILLLAEADNAKHVAVRQSLTCAALESMLFTRDTSVTEDLSRRAVTLLEPLHAKRAEAQKSVRKLYKYRCDTMHGRRLKHDAASADQTRRLASGVCLALIEWAGLQKRASGDKATHESLSSELQDAWERRKPVVGVPGELAECLPKFRNRKS